MVRRSSRRLLGCGFTLIELLVVMAIVALLVSIVSPRYFKSVDRGREVALRTTLVTVRDAIDQFKADKGRYPESLQDLVDQRYLRALPEDPITVRKDTWVVVAPRADDTTPGQLADVRTSASGHGADGVPYADW